MAKWAFWTVLLYIALVIILFVPVLLWLAFMGENSISDILDMYSAWQFWAIVGFFIVIQASLSAPTPHLASNCGHCLGAFDSANRHNMVDIGGDLGR